MSEDQKEREYLLDDEEYSRVMSYHYKKAGQPRDALLEKRTWSRLKRRILGGSPRAWMFSLSALAAVVILVIFVRVPGQEQTELEHRPLGKSGLQSSGFSVEWIDKPEGKGLKLRSHQPRFVSIYASDLHGQRQRVYESFQLAADQEHFVSVSHESAMNWQRICAVTAESSDELQALEQILDGVWSQLSEHQCVNIR